MAACVKKCPVAHKYSVACLYAVKEIYLFSLYQFSFDKRKKQASKTLLVVVFRENVKSSLNFGAFVDNL